MSAERERVLLKYAEGEVGGGAENNRNQRSRSAELCRKVTRLREGREWNTAFM